MKKILDYGQQKQTWPTPEVAKFAYKHTTQGSALRRVVADLLGRENPLKSCKTEDEDWKKWKELFAKYPELSLDMLCVDGNLDVFLVDEFGVAESVAVWSDHWKECFMEKEIPIDERWEEQILAHRGREAIEKNAACGCVKSILELKHLDRSKVIKVDDADSESDFEIITTQG